MKAIYALYESPESAQRAVNSLRSAGIEDADITILSSEPLEHYEFGQRDQQTWIWTIAAAGGIVGFTIGSLLTSLTQLAWPLNTGGMPIVSIWPNMIPIFELTMLGAILSAVVTLITVPIPSRFDSVPSTVKVRWWLVLPSSPLRFRIRFGTSS